MPIIVPKDIPAAKILQSENIIVMNDKRASMQDIRPLEIAIVNLMPTKIVTETQLMRLLSNSPLQVNVTLISTESYVGKNTPLEHLERFYKSFSEVKNRKFDGMIITGAPVEEMEFSEVKYWKELEEIFEFAKHNVTSTLFICWGAQAALHYYYVIEKHILDNYSAIVRSMGNPDFFINTQDPDLYYALNGFLAQLGIKVIHDKTKAHFIVDADCQYLGIKDEHYGNGIQIDLGIILSDVKTGQQLFSMRNIPRLTSSYSGNFHQIRQSAAKKAFRSMKKQIHKNLDKVIMDWVLNGHPVEIVIHNFNGDREIAKKILSAINLVPCAQTDTYLIEGNDLKFNCTYTGPTADLEDFLIERLSRDYSADMQLPKTINISLSKLEMSF